MQESHPKRPSRIYAGCDVSTPIDPLVPVALLVPFAAVWKVRDFMLAHSYERFGQGPGVEALDQAVLWLIAGMAICGLAALRLFVRGRDEWGVVPLAFGFVACAWAWLLTTWFSFDDQGILPITRMDTYFPALLAFTVALLCLTHGVFRMLDRARPIRPALRWTVLVGAVVSGVVVLGATSAVKSALLPESDSALYIACRPPTLPERFSYDKPRPRGFFEVHSYMEHEGSLLVSRNVTLKQHGVQVDDYDEVECGRDSSERARATAVVWNSPYAPQAYVALDAEAEAWKLHCIAADLRVREPATLGFSVISWRVGRSASFAGIERASPFEELIKKSWFYTCERDGDVPVVVLRRGKSVKVEYDGGPQELREVLQAAYRDRYDDDLPALRVRIQPGVSLQAFLDLRDSWLRHQTYRHFDWIIDAGYWPPSGE